MPAYNTNNVTVETNQNGQSASTVVATMYKERRERLQNERRNSWLSDAVKKHAMK